MTEIYAHKRLESLLQNRNGTLYIALSGGIDSITLMTVAARLRAEKTVALHAVSAAVPEDATERCRQLADRFGWNMQVLDAGEFNDQRYLDNPLNRCYYCKSNLFARIQNTVDVSNATIATGTNCDDLGDFRPGLAAASENEVWQPFVEASIGKVEIRSIAAKEALGKLAELPAQPCLASRVETGISINPADLKFAHKIERTLAARLGDGDIRCRITSKGVVAQLPAEAGVFSNASELRQIESMLVSLCAAEGRSFNRVEAYRMGSAFLKPQS